MKGLSKWLVTRTPVSRVERLVVAAAVAVLLTVEPACGPALVGAARVLLLPGALSSLSGSSSPAPARRCATSRPTRSSARAVPVATRASSRVRRWTAAALVALALGSLTGCAGVGEFRTKIEAEGCIPGPCPR